MAICDLGHRRRVGEALTPADAPIGPPGRNAEDRLDEALQETFPASDPISTRIEDPADEEPRRQGR